MKMVYAYVVFSTDGQSEPGAMRKQTWATQARLRLFKPEGRRLKGFPKVSVLSRNSSPGYRRAGGDLEQKLCLGIEQS